MKFRQTGRKQAFKVQHMTLKVESIPLSPLIKDFLKLLESKTWSPLGIMKQDSEVQGLFLSHRRQVGGLAVFHLTSTVL